MVSNHSENDSNDSEPFYTEPEGWVNYGDVNPLPHGGIFTRWEGNMWHIVETTHGQDVPDGVCDDDHVIVTQQWVEPEEVWVDGKPENGFTDTFRGQISGRHRYHDGVEEVPDLDENWNLILSEIAHFGAHYRSTHRHTTIPAADYWETLEDKHDITPEE